MNRIEKAPEGARVLVLGASDKEERYANKAFKLLRENGFEVIPVHPRIKQIEGVAVHASVGDAAAAVVAAAAGASAVDTVSLYVNGDTVLENAAAIISLAPRRVIMNPGTENAAAAKMFADHGIEVLEACTLVMLKTGQF